jgi:hypothetical protein
MKTPLRRDGWNVSCPQSMIELPGLKTTGREEGRRMPCHFDIAAVRSAKIKELHGYWLKIRGDRPMPARKDIDPAAIKGLLPNIFLVEFATDPFRVRYRLAGTAVVERAKFDYTGRFLDEIDFGADEPEDWQEFYRQVWQRKAPLFGQAAELLDADRRSEVPYEFCILPLSVGGVNVTGAIALEDYRRISLAERDYLRKVLPKGGSG